MAADEDPSCTIGVEFPYAVVRGETVNAESARAFGHDLGRALHIYLKGKTTGGTGGEAEE
ncbi:hypothetical protein HQ520_14125 [bacterium]|nr:hypothetical protein [bacterium]